MGLPMARRKPKRRQQDDFSRINLTIPRELHERLKQRKAEVNMSAVATRALEERLEQLDARAEAVDDLVAAAQRLAQGALQQQRETLVRRSEQEGRRWMIEYVEDVEYDHLHALFADSGDDNATAWGSLNDAIDDYLADGEGIDDTAFRRAATDAGETIWRELQRALGAGNR